MLLGGVIIGILLVIFIQKLLFVRFKQSNQQKTTNCGDVTLVKYCSSNDNLCTVLCDLCSCKTPLCAVDPLCQ